MLEFTCPSCDTTNDELTWLKDNNIHKLEFNTLVICPGCYEPVELEVFRRR